MAHRHQHSVEWDMQWTGAEGGGAGHIVWGPLRTQSSGKQ